MRSFKIFIENVTCTSKPMLQLFYIYMYILLLLNFCIWSSTCESELNNQSFFRAVSSTILTSNVDSYKRNLNFYHFKRQRSTKDYKNLTLSFRLRSDRYSKREVQKNLYFIYYKNGRQLFRRLLDIESYSGRIYEPIIKSCVGEKISFIFHGWTESCQTEWIPKLIDRLTFHRGGCIICVDYSTWSKQPYIELLKKFDLISEVLYEEVLLLMQNGINPNEMFMFGFSYGGQIASKIGRLLRPKYNINKIDICDMAGPGFDFLSYLNHSEAAENVQCYYSSLDKGSHFHSCHQNIRLGHCGYTQPAILSQPYFSSHGLCVHIYINAFDFPFYALQNLPRLCERGKTISNLPHGFTVGYKEAGYNGMVGDIFVPTSLNYPYNLSKREIVLYRKYLRET